jgi:hypothetical protein
MADWVTISALATAGGTLVLAVATFAAVRSANRSNRAAERAVQLSIRPVLVASRLDDAPEKVGFVDGHWMKVAGGQVGLEVTDDAIYLVLPLRNVGSGLAVLDRWDLEASALRDTTHRPIATFRRLTRDLYVAAGDHGFWQGTLRDPTEPLFAEVRRAILDRQPLTLDLLYGDHEAGQRTVTRFGLMPAQDDVWLAASSRYWYIDQDDPR